MKTSLKEKQKPNYERIKDSIIYAKKQAYSELRKKKIEFINATFIADDGSFSVIGDYDKYINDIHDAEMKFAEVSQDLIDYNEDPNKYINKVFPEVK